MENARAKDSDRKLRDQRYYKTEKGKRTRIEAQRRYEATPLGWAKKQIRRINYRCGNHHAKMFYRYGGREIKLKLTAEELVELIGDGEYLGRHLHRINNDGDYEISNVVLLSAKDHRACHWDGVPI